MALPPVFSFVTYATLGVELPFRLLPALTAASLSVLIWSYWSQPKGRIVIIADLLLWVFAAGCLTRLGLRSVPYHYGFYLLPVPFLALGVLLFRDLPKFLGHTNRAQLVIKATGFGVVAGIIIATFGISRTFYAEHTMDVDTPRGHILLRGEPWQKEVISYLQKFDPDTRIEIIPQGAGLLFLSGVRMAGGLYLYAPMELFGNYTDQEVVRRLQSWPPDLVIFLTQDPGSFRYTGFGIVFGWQTAKWLRMNYVPVGGNREVIILRYAGADNVSHPLPGAP
jgi:hypothetical protein